MSAVEEVDSEVESQSDMPTTWDPNVHRMLAASLRGYGLRFAAGLTDELLEAIAFSTNLGHHNMYMLDAAHVNTYLKGLGPVGVKAMVANILEKAAPNTPWVNGSARASRARPGSAEPRSPARSPMYKELYKLARTPADAPVLVNPFLTFAEGCAASLKAEEEVASATPLGMSGGVGVAEIASAVAQAFATNGVFQGSAAGADNDDGLAPRRRKNRLPTHDARKWRAALYGGDRQLVSIELAEERPSDEAMELAAMNLGYGGHGDLPLIPYYETKPYIGTLATGWGGPTRALLPVRCTDRVSGTLSGRVVSRLGRGDLFIVGPSPPSGGCTGRLGGLWACSDPPVHLKVSHTRCLLTTCTWTCASVPLFGCWVCRRGPGPCPRAIPTVAVPMGMHGEGLVRF